MLVSINAFLQVMTITIGTFMVERYVLLEPPMEPKKQRLFYVICFCSMLAAFLLIGENAQYLALVFGALNIWLGRKKHRVLGSLMVISLIGLINGIGAPMFIVQAVLATYFDCAPESSAVQLGVMGVYLIIVGFMAVFYFRGKEWRRWFGENMKDRSARRSERVLIFVSGLVMTIFTNYIAKTMTILTDPGYSFEIKRILAAIFILFECMSLMTTVILIVLVMQGNKRKFYHDRVSGMQFSVIATMADIVEDRDSNTGGHIKRTAKYVEIIGKYLLKRNEFPDILTRQYLEDMVVAAPLHDIGKISVPDAILNKPGKLTDEEFEIMKKHASAGRDVLQKAEKQMGKFEYLEIAKDMAEYHHEWFNGKGYPTGISGGEIPLCARIMAVADVFDALTSKRCYKQAMPVEKAYDIISSESGTHFDPVVAEAFLNSRTEIEEALQQLSEDEF